MIYLGKLSIKKKVLLSGIIVFSLVLLIIISYATITSRINITGTAVNRKSKWKIKFENLGNVVLNGTAEEVEAPTIKNDVEISDYLVSLSNPSDSVTYKFDVTNDGDYDAKITSINVPTPSCHGAGDYALTDAQNVCSHLTYTLTYENGDPLLINQTLNSKESKTLKLTLVYDTNTPVASLPKDDVAISNLGVTVTYAQVDNAKTNSDGTTPKETLAVTKLLSKSNSVSATYTQGSEASHQMYAFEHPATEQTEALTDYRYIGNDPYNYVDFNGETWRIIGIFSVEDGSGNTSQRIKIIKDEKLSDNMAWDSSNATYSPNEWTTATLNTYLNGDYYSGLSNDAQEMISPAKTYLGGRRFDNTTNLGTSEDMYSWERGTDRYDSSRSLNDTKNISLIYPSDYTYTYAKGIDNTCYSDGYYCSTSRGNPSKGWLYKSSYSWWTVSHYANYYYTGILVKKLGSVQFTGVYYTVGIRPVVYLIPDIQFDGGDGSSGNHYKLKI